MFLNHAVGVLPKLLFAFEIPVLGSHFSVNVCAPGAGLGLDACVHK